MGVPERSERGRWERPTVIQTEGEAQKIDFADLLGDDVGYASFDSWWTNYVKAKDALKQLPNVDPPGEGQLFAYHVAELKDRNVDESRNPAKSVTVQ